MAYYSSKIDSQNLPDNDLSDYIHHAQKLEADHYVVDDLDGITESMIASGNMGYAFMQSTITDDKNLIDNAFQGDNLIINQVEGNGVSGNKITFFNNNGNLSQPNILMNSGDSINFSEGQGTGGASANTSFVNATLGSSAINQIEQNYSASNTGNTNNFTTGTSSSNTINQSQTTNSNVTINENYTTIEENLISIDNTIENIISIDVSSIINANTVVNIVTNSICNTCVDFDFVANIVNNTTNQIFTNILNPAVNLIPHITDKVDTVVDKVDVVVGNLLDGILNPEIENNSDVDIDLDNNLDLAGLDVVDVVVDAIIDPVENIVGDVDVISDLGINLLHPDTSETDSDIDILGDVDLLDNDLLSPDIEINLDPVENIVGDIDLDLDVVADVLGSDDSPSHDSSIINTPLDDFDLSVGDAINLLSHNDNQPDNGNDQDCGEWTDNVCVGDGGLFNDIINGGDTGHDILPDPVGTISEGLGVLDVDLNLDVGGFGGLFG